MLAEKLTAAEARRQELETIVIAEQPTSDLKDTKDLEHKLQNSLEANEKLRIELETIQSAADKGAGVLSKALQQRAVANRRDTEQKLALAEVLCHCATGLVVLSATTTSQ